MIDLKLVQDFTCKLHSKPVFADTTDQEPTKNYSTYVGVPVGDICLEGRPIHMVQYDRLQKLDYKSIDLVICVDEAVCLAVLFGRDKDQLNDLFGKEAPLENMQYVSLATCDTTEEGLNAAYKRICFALEMAEQIDPAENRNYTLSVLDFEVFISENAHDKLKDANMLTKNGEITPYSSSSGVFLAVRVFQNDEIRTAYSYAYHATGRLLDLICPRPKYKYKKQMPLRQRLARVQAGMPSDVAYEQWLMDQFNQLYDTPLEEFFRLSSNNGAAATGEFHSLQRCILQAKSALPPSMECGELTTIKDVLALAYQLCPAGSKNEQAITLCRQLLVALCAPVVDRNVPPQNSYSGRHVQSLSKRLEVISGSYLPMYQLFFMPPC